MSYDYDRTDLGNSAFLVDLHGEDLRYCSTWDAWLVWDGSRWARDNTGEAMRRAKDAVLKLRRRGSDRYDEDGGALFKHAIRSQNESRLKAMLSLARSDPAVAVGPSIFDSNPYLLNCLNGTVNLHTGKLLAHQRKHYLTKLAPVAYDPDAKCRKFLTFLYRIMGGNKKLIAYLKRAIGYSLTGDVSEQVLFFAYGTGANGKSTLFGVIQKMLGAHAMQAPPELLVAKGRTHPTEQASLAGARFVATTEVEQGRRLAESLVKQITGGDLITARRMHEDFWEFSPTHKIWLAANHKPGIVGTDWAMWRRIKVIPFDVTIPDDQQDKDLLAKLAKELPGILTWAVEGCLEWKRDRLGEPPVVAQATAAYRAEMDVLGNFLTDCFIESSTARAPVKDVNEAYATWCQENGETPFALKELKTQIEKRGFGQKRNKGFRYYAGIGLRADEDARRLLGSTEQGDDR